MQFICYPKCSTCRKAKKWLDDNGLEYEERNIAVDNPTKDELWTWKRMGGHPTRKFFNTSGLKYKELRLKDKLPGMSDSEMVELLASDGMLVKRPILVIDNFGVLVGFDEEDWNIHLEWFKSLQKK